LVESGIDLYVVFTSFLSITAAAARVWKYWAASMFTTGGGWLLEKMYARYLSISGEVWADLSIYAVVAVSTIWR
jgi:hypothetical protein